jgi:hypothetical protein
MFAKGLLGMLIVALAGAAAPASSQDALRVRQLENDINRLQRELEAQSRRIDELERATRSVSATVSTAAPDIIRKPESLPAWLLPTNWDRIRPGMKELDVIALLGRPTSVRTDPDGKTHALLYAIELGPTAVLAGNVRLNDSGVAEVNKPILR